MTYAYKQVLRRSRAIRAVDRLARYQHQCGRLIDALPFVGEAGYDPDKPARYRRLPLPFAAKPQQERPAE